MNITTAILGVMQDIGIIGKDSTNDQQHFKYRGIDAVMNALNPALIKNNLIVIPEVIEQTREERTTSKGGLLIYSILKMRFTFMADDGSKVEAITIGEGMDSGDKASNKAMSVAYKYACFQVFCIPTEELIDEPDKECHDVAPKTLSFEQLKNIREEQTRTGITDETLCGMFKVAKVVDIPGNCYEAIMAKFAKTGNK